MQHIVALSRVAVIIRHWFEIDLTDSSLEHGVRIELRELPRQPRRGSESAAQLICADRPLWRADLFDRVTDVPGTFAVAHFHPQFDGNEPSPRVFDQLLSREPWRWLGEQFGHLGAGSGPSAWPVDPADGDELSARADQLVALARELGPATCTSAAQCHELTRDAADAVQVMLGELTRPDLLDEDWVKPWRGGVASRG